jgi:hypothetical protein
MWRDISDAKTDEDMKIIAFNGVKVGEAIAYHDTYWDDEEEVVGEYQFLEWRWANDSCSCCWGRMEPQPTHFMDIPLPPDQ